MKCTGGEVDELRGHDGQSQLLPSGPAQPVRGFSLQDPHVLAKQAQLAVLLVIRLTRDGDEIEEEG